jgi:hypothetical protein
MNESAALCAGPWTAVADGCWAPANEDVAMEASKDMMNKRMTDPNFLS